MVVKEAQESRAFFKGKKKIVLWYVQCLDMEQNELRLGFSYFSTLWSPSKHQLSEQKSQLYLIGMVQTQS